MCGICGIINFKDKPSEIVIRSMVTSIQHRGPDYQDCYVNSVVALGHARLSIIDLSVAANQPMQTSDGQYVIVYNGEIYNFKELCKELEQQGAVFKTKSDTEVVLNAYMLWGKDAFPRFNGMFALAIWDTLNKELILARDRFGIKPLYYYRFSSGLVFGSEIKSILASGFVEKREINPAGMHEYFYYGNALGQNTLFEGISKVLPGQYLAVGNKECASTSYWQIDDVPQNNDDMDMAVSTVRDRLEQAVNSHLVSDVPVGVFLSGGIDSSCITAFASKHYHGRLQTFSVGFDFDRGVNELPNARFIANYFNTDHHELHVEGYKLPELIERLVQCHDEPFADAANIPLYLLCEKLNGSPKVILQGDGGDEIFAGYRRYNVLAAHGYLRLGVQLALRVNKLSSKNAGYYRRHRFLNAIGNTEPAMRMAMLLTQETLYDPPTKILSPEWQEAVGDYDPFIRYREFNRRFGHLDLVQRMLYTDTGIILPDTFLEKVDKSTMAHGIEVRVPMLDNYLTDYVLGLPSSVKIKRGQKKWILRKALRGIIPDIILDGPKTGFGVPYSYWLRKPLANYMKSVLLDSSKPNNNYFDKKRLTHCIDEHISGKRNHGFFLWKALNFALWGKMYSL